MTHDPLRTLRKAVEKQVEAEGLRPFSLRSGLPLGQVRSILQGHAPNSATIESVSEFFDFEFYIGPKKDRKGVGQEPSRTELLAKLLDVFMSIEKPEAQAVFVEACQVMAQKKSKGGSRAKRNG